VRLLFRLGRVAEQTRPLHVRYASHVLFAIFISFVINFGLNGMGEMRPTFDHNPPPLGSVVARQDSVAHLPAVVLVGVILDALKSRIY
jgi:hypothetical protein